MSGHVDASEQEEVVLKSSFGIWLFWSCNVSGFIDDTLRWIGNEVYMEFHLHENGRQILGAQLYLSLSCFNSSSFPCLSRMCTQAWMEDRWSYDPLNSAAEFTYATQCQIAAILILATILMSLCMLVM